MNDIQLFALTSLICAIVSYSYIVRADHKQNASTPAMKSNSATMEIPENMSGSWLATKVTENSNHTTRWRRCLALMGAALGGAALGGPPFGGPPSGKPPSGGPPSFKPPFGDLPFGGPPLGGLPFGGPLFGGPPSDKPPSGGPPPDKPPPGKPPSCSSTTEKTKIEKEISKATSETTKFSAQAQAPPPPPPPTTTPPPPTPPPPSTTEKSTTKTEITKNEYKSTTSKIEASISLAQAPPPPPPTTTPPPPPEMPPSTTKKSTTEVEITKNGYTSTTSKIEASISLLPPDQTTPPPPTTTPPPPDGPPSTTKKTTTETEITKNGYKTTTSKIEASISLLPPDQTPPPPTTTPSPPPNGPPSNTDKTTTETEITKNGYKSTTSKIEASMSLLPPDPASPSEPPPPGPPPTTTPPPPPGGPPSTTEDNHSERTTTETETSNLSKLKTLETFVQGEAGPPPTTTTPPPPSGVPRAGVPTLSTDTTTITTSTNTSLSSVISAMVSYSTKAGADPQGKFKDTEIGSAISKILPDGEIKDKFEKLENQDFVQISSVISAIVSYSTTVGANPADPKQKVKDTTIGSMISNLLPDGKVKEKFDQLENQDITQISTVISAIVSYSINVGAGPLDPNQKVKDTTIGSAISKILPDGEIKDKFDKLENQDVMDTMELLKQSPNMKNIDEFLGKLYAKNPEAANFVKVVLKKLGCSEDDATMSCKTLIEYKDKIMGGLTAPMSGVQNADTANKTMQSLTNDDAI